MHDKARIEKLMVDCGHAINANNGRCYLIEEVLCRVTTLCVELLNDMDEQAYSEEMHRQNDPNAARDAAYSST